jgi:hypothetical protein
MTAPSLESAKEQLKRLQSLGYSIESVEPAIEGFEAPAPVA